MFYTDQTQVSVPEKCVSLQTKCNVRERKTFLCVCPCRSSIYLSSVVVTLFTTMLNPQKLKIINTEFMCLNVNLRTNGNHFNYAKLTTGFYKRNAMYWRKKVLTIVRV